MASIATNAEKALTGSGLGRLAVLLPVAEMDQGRFCDEVPAATLVSICFRRAGFGVTERALSAERREKPAVAVEIESEGRHASAITTNVSITNALEPKAGRQVGRELTL